MFSDSQLRPVVGNRLSCPANWFINATPGGTFRDVAIELKAASLPVEPEAVVMLVGTNGASNHCVMERASFTRKNATEDFASMLIAASEKFRRSQVCTSH